MAGKIDLRRLPPLKALRGFEAATRHQSIRDAAGELCLTHPAITHQVQLIEEALGVRLFTQEGRHIVSTPEGRLFYPYVRAAFDSLLEGVEAVQRNAVDRPLRVQTYITASIRWLAPRVPRFLAEHPEVQLTLSTCAVDWDFHEMEADVGLIYCEQVPDPAKYQWVPLFDYATFPVCSPAMLESMGSAPNPAALMTRPLITIYTEVHNWGGWFESAGIEFTPQHPYIMVDTLAMALEMAMAGEGVALVNGPFVNRELDEGRLVVPVAHREVCPGSWGLICRTDSAANPRVRTFIDWVAAQVGPATA